MAYLSSTGSSNALETSCPNTFSMGGGTGVLRGYPALLVPVSNRMREKGVWDYGLFGLCVGTWKVSKVLDT